MHVQALSESGCLANGSKPTALAPLPSDYSDYSENGSRPTALARLPSDYSDPWRTGLIVHRKSQLQPPACVWLDDPDSSDGCCVLGEGGCGETPQLL